ncbi:hypothetical protein CRG98_028086 [Punica granatum]|uniref:Uncharacterized protein n=1 Tax=Punica granatum TaxID=22663 RepID=A0A2I0J750_PUNGR|nr:hypothetical protein CRG98_028086 [Punica granatum]
MVACRQATIALASSLTTLSSSVGVSISRTVPDPSQETNFRDQIEILRERQVRSEPTRIEDPDRTVCYKSKCSKLWRQTIFFLSSVLCGGASALQIDGMVPMVPARKSKLVTASAKYRLNSITRRRQTYLSLPEGEEAATLGGFISHMTDRYDYFLGEDPTEEQDPSANFVAKDGESSEQVKERNTAMAVDDKSSLPEAAEQHCLGDNANDFSRAEKLPQRARRPAEDCMEPLADLAQMIDSAVSSSRRNSRQLRGQKARRGSSSQSKYRAFEALIKWLQSSPNHGTND